MFNFVSTVLIGVYFTVGIFLGISILKIVMEFVDSVLDKIFKTKKEPIYWYNVMWKDAWQSYQAHNEAELIAKLQAFICLLGENFVVYKVPDKDCYDVSQWELVIDDTLPDAEVEADEKE